MFTPGTVPASFESFVEQYDRFITWSIRRIARHHLTPDDLADLKQAVYLRAWQKHYLERCRYLIAERGTGQFSTYVGWLVRSVVVNVFKSRARLKRRTLLRARPLLDARVTEHVPGGVHPERSRRYRERFSDLEFEDRLLSEDTLRRLAKYVSQTEQGALLARTLQLAYEGYTTPELSEALGTTREQAQQCWSDLQRHARAVLAS